MQWPARGPLPPFYRLPRQLLRRMRTVGGLTGNRRLGFVAHHDAQVVLGAVIGERDRLGIDPGAIERGPRDAALRMIRVLHLDLVTATPVAPAHDEAFPRRWDAGRDCQRRPPQSHPEDRLEPEPIHPGRRA